MRPIVVGSLQEDSMPAQTTDLFLVEDLEDVGRTSELADSVTFRDGSMGRGCTMAGPQRSTTMNA
jgi:hypothetical protein